jgi:hypothetical protein
VQLSFHTRTKLGSSFVIKRRESRARDEFIFERELTRELSAAAVHETLPLTEIPNPLQFSRQNTARL